MKMNLLDAQQTNAIGQTANIVYTVQAPWTDHLEDLNKKKIPAPHNL